MLSMKDHRLKFNKVWTYIRALEAQEKLKDLVEDLNKGQPEVNILNQKRRSHLEASEDQTLDHQALSHSDLESPRLCGIQTLKDPKVKSSLSSSKKGNFQ